MTPQDKHRLVEAHEPHWLSAGIWLAFLAAFTAAEAMVVWAVWQHSVVWVVFSVFVVAHLMHSHLIAFHEAAHGTLCPNQLVNDALGVFVGNLSFMGLSLYRAAHHYHHAFLASPRDEELWPFVLPGTPRWARIIAATAELTLGLFFTPILFLRTFLRSDSPIRNTKVRLRIWLELGGMASMWAMVLAAVAWFDLWTYLVVLYLVPAMIAGDMQSLRKYIEHMGLTGTTVLGSTRSVTPPGLLGRLFTFSLFNVSYHGVHHKYAKMPHTELPKFPEMLKAQDVEDVEPYMTYWEGFLDMVKGLADPRVGPQWRECVTKEKGAAHVRIGRKPRRSNAGALRQTPGALSLP